MKTDSKPLSVLLLDDDLLEINQMERAVQEEPREVCLRLETFRTVEKFVERLAGAKPDIIILDINLGQDKESAGISLIETTRRTAPRSTILMQSNLDRLKNIRDCLEKGADDFISKKTEPSAIKLRILLSHQAAQSKRVSPGPSTKSVSVGVGATARKLASRIPKIMNSAVTAVHVFGESGTGKEIVADMFESLAPQGAPFVRIHCGAINPQIMESELFGHKRGAFTGANQDRVGLIEAANHGYVFLDEVATLSPAAQVALLRVLEAKTIRPVGDTVSRDVSIKVISATNEDLRGLVEQGKFRKDLLQRLCELRIDLPPLRDRSEEIPELIEHFAGTMDGGPYSLTPPTIDILRSVSWKNGNIRELRNCLRAMTEFATDRVLTPLCVPSELWKEVDSLGEEGSEFTSSTQSAEIRLRWVPHSASYDDLADSLLLDLIHRISVQNGKRSMRFVAGELGIPRSTLSDRLRSLVERGKTSGNDLGKMVNLGAETPVGGRLN